jgi:hypothetical protein
MKKLPIRYASLQYLLDEPSVENVNEVPDYTSLIQKETDPEVIHSLVFTYHFLCKKYPGYKNLSEPLKLLSLDHPIVHTFDPKYTFTNLEEEKRFYQNQKDLELYQPLLDQGNELITSEHHVLEGLKLCFQTLLRLNEKRSEIWSTCPPSFYKEFRKYF